MSDEPFKYWEIGVDRAEKVHNFRDEENNSWLHILEYQGDYRPWIIFRYKSGGAYLSIVLSEKTGKELLDFETLKERWGFNYEGATLRIGETYGDRLTFFHEEESSYILYEDDVQDVHYRIGLTRKIGDVLFSTLGLEIQKRPLDEELSGDRDE